MSWRFWSRRRTAAALMSRAVVAVFTRRCRTFFTSRAEFTDLETSRRPLRKLSSRVRASYIWALLMAWAPISATAQAKSTSSMVNSRGSEVKRRMTPMTWPLLTMGTATKVAMPSSLACWGYCMRGSVVAS